MYVLCMHWLVSPGPRFSCNRNIAAKLLMDRFVITPPFLALTLFALRFLENGRFREALNGTRQAYLPALKANYKVIGLSPSRILPLDPFCNPFSLTLVLSICMCVGMDNCSICKFYLCPSNVSSYIW